MGLQPAVHENGNIAVVTGTLPSNVGDSVSVNYPTGFNVNNTCVIGFQISSSGWRYGIINAQQEEPASIVVSTTIDLVLRMTYGAGKDFKLTLYKSN